MISHSRPCLTAADHEAVDAVLHSGMIAEGELVEELERVMAAYLGLAGGVATAGGACAIYLGLRALGAGGGDEVILPTYVCGSVYDAVRAVGATPILCDVGEDWCLNVDTVRPCLSSRTRAIIAVHTFGIAADLPPICELGPPVIEDCCQALGAAGTATLGAMCVLSFHATKLMTTGEGGMALTREPALLAKLRSLQQGGEPAERRGFRPPLSDLQAALGLSQMKRYDRFLERRRELADRYFDGLRGLSVALPDSVSDRSIFYRFPLRGTADFERDRRAFAERGVHVRRGVDALLHHRPGLPDEHFPGAQACFSSTLSIPLYPVLDDDQCRRIVDASRQVFALPRGH